MRNLCLGGLVLLLSACVSNARYRLFGPYEHHDAAPKHCVNVNTIPNATPKAEPKSRYGNPPHYVVFGERYTVLPHSHGYVEEGIASWYGTKFHAKRTSSGEPYNMYAMTAAHKSLPLPTYAKITNLQNHRVIVVKINDRGPFKQNRIIDLSYVAAKKLGILKRGTGLIRLEAIDPKHWDPAQLKHIHFPKHPELYLQLGVFSSQWRAHHTAQQVKKHMPAATLHIKPLKTHTKTLYRLQIGPIATIETSDKIYKTLAHLKLGKPMTIIHEGHG